jgi:Putative redox-active protein (C_GCAxxG_C_C)
MDDTMIRTMRLAQKGYTCSQILILLALEARGEQNPALVRAAAGLAYGCGTGKGSCGVLTGGSCAIALFAGKGSDEEQESEKFMMMLQDLSDWFSEHVGGQYGGIECQAIVGEEGPASTRQRCGTILAETYAKVMEILFINGFDV